MSRPAILCTAAVYVFALLDAVPVSAQPAPPARTPPARTCYFSRQISSWSEDGESAVILRFNVEDNYRLILNAPCPELRYTMGLGVVSSRGGDSICTGDTFDLLVRDPSGVGTDRCLVTGMTPISREEAAAALRHH